MTLQVDTPNDFDVFSPFQPLCTAQLPPLHMWIPCPATHTHVLAPTHKQPHARSSRLLPHQNLRSKGIIRTKRQRNGIFSSLSRLLLLHRSRFPFPLFPTPPSPLSKSIASREGKRRTSYLRSPPEGSRVGFSVSSAAPG